MKEPRALQLLPRAAVGLLPPCGGERISAIFAFAKSLLEIQERGFLVREETPDRARRFAKSLRENATEAERKLWSIVRGGRLEGYKFKRQVPLEGYIVDFVCFETRLIVEADGSQHVESDRDAVRDQRLADAGFMTLRVWNNEVLANPDGVVLSILGALRRKL